MSHFSSLAPLAGLEKCTSYFLFLALAQLPQALVDVPPERWQPAGANCLFGDTNARKEKVETKQEDTNQKVTGLTPGACSLKPLLKYAHTIILRYNLYIKQVRVV